MSGYEQVSDSATDSVDFEITVTTTCPPGKKVLSGGWFAELVGSGPTDAAAVEDYPSANDEWTVTAFAFASTGNWTLTVFAICATVT